ncbi:hypothetical protein KM540_gp150 [Western grey kangaroopox virus]|uniref:Uncharacterized protein n=1 Tax=Western grey kangaroopox virus TaxID=1566307 RepID=A0A2C9DSU8_9POXV|nr:hypothetical protein KM540_gp150 [Western grey kangaroopox virus]ATI21081.1 hypothetical protein [Western grey kangaroopox virus]
MKITSAPLKVNATRQEHVLLPLSGAVLCYHDRTGYCRSYRSLPVRSLPDTVRSARGSTCGRCMARESATLVAAFEN